MWGPAAAYGRPRRPAAGYGGSRHSAYTVIMAVQLIQRIMALEHKPPVTLALMAANALVFFGVEPFDVAPPLERACLQPRMVLKYGQLSRLCWSPFVHADEFHLLYNLSSLLWKGARLEARLGPATFAALTAELLALSQGLLVVGAWAVAEAVPEYRHLYTSTCAVGFSGVLFAYKVVLNHDDATTSTVLGIPLPTKYMAWAELLLASALNPRASFAGHLAGIAAGLLHVRAAAALRRGGWARRLAAAARRVAGAAGGGARGPRFAGGGATGARAPTAQAHAQAQLHARQPPRPAPPQPQPPQQPPPREAAAAAASGVRQISDEELRQRRLVRFQQ
ncbi:hypothetical protein Rsub_09672 [Raphidocelis subcapitata]|uniref:Peptidase S54 rhomboid domain-containing protein n=1 Tax=Raphidocelis subcapitata TaxID=307507 RepID=A0A2V0PAE1_9CHLO|nr:hypothetical protein Rsub_09672 [Raphidocelis subcapitata]|eukprot:GBF96816.1 hypothetical protein Rsub_09672 [Raphidocelis subcapitata]